MSGRVVHFEIPFDDQDARARAFYAEAFGWDLRDGAGAWPTSWRPPGPSDEGRPASPASSTAACSSAASRSAVRVLVLDVEDIDATLETVERLGGTTVSAKQPVGEMGFSAYFTDPEGNLMGLWQTPPRRLG